MDVVVTAASGSARIAASPASFTIDSTNFAAGQVVTFTPAAVDFEVTGPVSYTISYIISAAESDDAYLTYDLSSTSIVASLADVDVRGLVVGESGSVDAVSSVSVVEGASAVAMGISLQSMPTGDVVVRVAVPVTFTLAFNDQEASTSKSGSRI